MSKLINFSSKNKKRPNLRFSHKSLEIIEGEDIRYRVFIVLLNKDNGRFDITPFSDFLNYNWRNCKHTTILRKANIIVPFLNYIIIDEVDTYKIKSLEDLTFDMGSDFLNLYRKGELSTEKRKNIIKSKASVKMAETVLAQFFFFLSKHGVLRNININDFYIQERFIKGKKIQMVKSPFEVYYPSNTNKSIIHNLPKELVIPFIETAIEITPSIALGIYFQFFGGLRVGEICNVTDSSLTDLRYGFKGEKGEKFGLDGMVINLKKRRIRFDLKKNSSFGGVKKPRYQPIIAYGSLLNELYKMHIKKYKPDHYSGAIFVNEAGLAMTTQVYRNKFYKLKNAFIEKLSKSKYGEHRDYALYLYQNKWSTHIGRGVFSNLVAESAETATEIALWRGDSSIDSAITYLQDTQRMSKKVTEHLFEINKKYMW